MAGGGRLIAQRRQAEGPAAAHGSSRALGTAFLVALALLPWLSEPTYAQTSAARALITTAVENNRLVRLRGNTRPEANARNDRGLVPDTLPLGQMQLLLKRPAER